MLAREVLGPAAGWNDNEELLAVVVDLLGQTNYLLGRAHFPKQAPAKPPKPVPRPGEQVADEELFVAEGDPPVTAEELAEFRKAPM